MGSSIPPISDQSSNVSRNSDKSAKVAGHSWSTGFSQALSRVVARVIRLFSRLTGARVSVDATQIRRDFRLLDHPEGVAQKVQTVLAHLERRPFDLSVVEAKEMRQKSIQKLVEADDPFALVVLLKGTADPKEQTIWQNAYDRLLKDYKREPDDASYTVLMEGALTRYGDTKEGNEAVQALLKGKIQSIKAGNTVSVERENKQSALNRLNGDKDSFHRGWAQLIGVFSKVQTAAEFAFNKASDAEKPEAEAVLEKAKADLKAVTVGYQAVTGRDARLPQMRMELASLNVGLHGNKLWDEAETMSKLSDQAEKPQADVKALGKAWQKTALDIVKKHPDMPSGLKTRLEESYKKFI